MTPPDLVAGSDLSDVPTSGAAFAGCSNRATLAAYVGALSFEQRSKGFVAGVGITVAAVVGLYLYARATSSGGRRASTALAVGE